MIADHYSAEILMLQEGDIPQQFADLGEWNEWVVGHFSNEEA